MRPRSTGSTEKGSYVAGIVTGFVLAALVPLGYGLVQWLLTLRFGGVVQWFTTEQTITYVPADTLWSLLGLFIVGLIMFAMMGYLMALRGGSVNG